MLLTEFDGQVPRRIEELVRRVDERGRDPEYGRAGDLWFALAAGKLLFERRMQGREVDEVVARLPTAWPKRKTDEGELPLVTPTIRTAATYGKAYSIATFPPFVGAGPIAMTSVTLLTVGVMCAPCDAEGRVLARPTR